MAKIIDTCFEHPEWGGQKLSDHLVNEQVLYTSPGTAQKVKNCVNEILTSKGYELELTMRYEVLHPNDLWATDIIEFDWCGKKLYLMLLIDEYSRCVLNWRISTSPTTELAVTLVDESIQKYGRPQAVKSDNGPQYRQTFASELEKRGIHDLSSPTYYPQYNGRIERLNADMKAVLNRAAHLDIQGLSDAVEKRIEEHNYVRPHQALGGVTPHTCYTGKAEQKRKERSEFKKRELGKRGYESQAANTTSQPEGILTPIRRDGVTVLSVRSFYEVSFQKVLD